MQFVILHRDLKEGVIVQFNYFCNFYLSSILFWYILPMLNVLPNFMHFGLIVLLRKFQKVNSAET